MVSNISVAGNMPPPPPEQCAPLFVLDDTVIFPYSLTPIAVVEDHNLLSLQAAMSSDRLLAIFYELPEEEQLSMLPLKMGMEIFSYREKRYGSVGVLVRVVKQMVLPDGSIKLLVRGVKRAVFESISVHDEVPTVHFRPYVDSRQDNNAAINRAAQKEIAGRFQELNSMFSGISDELVAMVGGAVSPGRAADLLGDALDISYAERLMVLTLTDITKRYKLLGILVERQLEVGRLGADIRDQVDQNLVHQQGEIYLREQLRVIQEKLGADGRSPDIVELEERIFSTMLPDEVEKVVKREFERLEMIPQSAPEYHIAYTYINWLIDLPWYRSTEDRYDCALAEKILEKDHFGLDDVKKRILEFLAVLQLQHGEDEPRRAPILCLVGPPGVGKTSLGQSVARAMGRKFIRVSLGGVRDEAEIRGHRRTYVGAMPGRIVQSLKKAGSNNPVFMLDEIDKLANEFRGDPASALLEVLDPAQNFAFNDHYIEVDCDLSQVFFIATANVLENIPDPLRDRMEIIQLPGYTSFEKREIARRYLVKRQITENGLKKYNIRFHMSAIDELIDHYTREAGVRQLERNIAQVLRRVARRITAGEYLDAKSIAVDDQLVRELLGSRRFQMDEADIAMTPGCAIGMAWTGCGGAILPIEAISLPGKGNLKLTGSLGKVMQESAETAFSLVRAHAAEWGIEPEFFASHDFHIHVPDGATPKDGPSAGVTMTVALISHLTGRPVRRRLSMTGEINLRGQVTVIGGVREKVIAALRAGVDTVLLPVENEKDFMELPEAIRGKISMHVIDNFHDACNYAFETVAAGDGGAKKVPAGAGAKRKRAVKARTVKK